MISLTTITEYTIKVCAEIVRLNLTMPEPSTKDMKMILIQCFSCQVMYKGYPFYFNRLHCWSLRQYGTNGSTYYLSST